LKRSSYFYVYKRLNYYNIVVSIYVCLVRFVSQRARVFYHSYIVLVSVTRDILLTNTFYHDITDIISSQDLGFVFSSWIKGMSGHRVCFLSLTHEHHSKFVFTRSNPVLLLLILEWVHLFSNFYLIFYSIFIYKSSAAVTRTRNRDLELYDEMCVEVLENAKVRPLLQTNENRDRSEYCSSWSAS